VAIFFWVGFSSITNKNQSTKSIDNGYAWLILLLGMTLVQRFEHINGLKIR